MSEERDAWSKAEVISSIIGGIFLPLIVWYVGHSLEQQQARSDAEQLELDRQQAEDQLRTERAISLLGYLSSENDRERLLAVKTADYLIESNQLPEELWGAFLEVSASDENPEVVAAVTEVVMARAAVDTAFADDVEDTFDEVPIRVYIHYPTPAHKPLAESIANIMQEKGYDVTPLDLMPMTGDAIKVLAFRAEEEGLAQTAAELLDANSLPTSPEVRTGFEDRTRLRQLEIWIGLGVAPQ